MTPEYVINVGEHALEITLALMALLLIPALAAGLLVSVFQAATQINEPTLSFIPKLLVTAGVMILCGPMLIRLLTDYTTELYRSIPSLVN